MPEKAILSIWMLAANKVSAYIFSEQLRHCGANVKQAKSRSWKARIELSHLIYEKSLARSCIFHCPGVVRLCRRKPGSRGRK